VNPRLRRSAAHVFVDSFDDPQLADEDDHHLRRVLRIRASDFITVSDGLGRWCGARLSANGLIVDGPIEIEHPPPAVAVICAIPKGDRPEWIVQKLTEIGASAIGFMDCSRGVVHWDAERGLRQVKRLRRIGREAAMQSRRVWLPEVRNVVPFAVAAESTRCALAEPGGDRSIDGIETMLIGPEGGFTDAELGLVARTVSLSDHVLRVETAALAAAVLMTQR
jgi:16S rRNA (uracil1498-N3)-methyltransferase